MPKYENPTTPKPPLDQEGQTLVAALTAAILAARDNAPAPNPTARAAADEYAVIKGVLRTHSVELPGATAVQQS